ncbi:MAG: SDR family oxidoreductase, partial [Proteobacteria bacterium]|nr:SDR family oxidoreductase [Pseudomonadota bacterium]
MSVILITGSSSGFGAAAARHFARNGDTVYASMRDPGKGGEVIALARRESLDIRPVELDVTRSAAFVPLLARIVRECGRIDVLVNNAGILRAGAFEDLEERDIREVLETNYLAPMLLARAALPHMRAQRAGCIIMISSLSGIAGLPGDVAYAGSKFALEGATEALRHEVDRWNIRVALVEAGLYATRIMDFSLRAAGLLPANYPVHSPYRVLIEHRQRELARRLSQAMDPDHIGRLLVEIVRSDGSQFRWPADEIARRVLSTMWAQDDATRDAFLRGVAGSDWWSRGLDAAPPES